VLRGEFPGPEASYDLDPLRVVIDVSAGLPPDSVRDDAMLTTAANNALAADATVPEDVEATVTDGNPTLTGTVQYLSQRAAVEKVVGGLIGVRHVRNEIDVISGVDAADVKRLVRKALDRSALVPDDSDVLVDASGSTVILTGHTRTRAERDAVVGATWMARGVAIVVDELLHASSPQLPARRTR
jgi:osmotically-inducible protein OsmY